MPFGLGITMKNYLLFAIAVLMWLPSIAQGQDERVVVVPYSQKFPELPHPSFEGDRKTLKAVVQNASCGNGYTVRWDTNRNQNFNDDSAFDVGRDGSCNCVRDAGRLYEVGDVDRDELQTFDVEVTSKCNANHKSYGTFQIYVYNFRPTSQANTWGQENPGGVPTSCSADILFA